MNRDIGSAITTRPLSLLICYGIPVVGVAVAVVLTQLLPPLHPTPFPLFVAAVTVSAWYGGFRPALVAVALSVLAADYFFVPPLYTLSLGWEEVVRAGVFVLVALLVVWFAEVRRRSEVVVREAAERFRVTFASISDAVITTDPHGRVTSLNPVAQSLTGWTQEQAQGRPLETVFRVINEQTRQPVASPAARALREGTVVGLANHSVLIAKDDTERPIDDSASPIRDEQGQVSGVVLIFRDITARRQAEEELRASEQRFARFMQHLPGLAWIKDLEGRYVYANDAAERAFRTSRAELYGKTDDEIFPPETAGQFQANDRRALAAEAGVLTVETLEHADGMLHHSLVSKFPITGPDGAPLLVGGVAIDITERKQAEEALRRRERELTDFLENATLGLHWAGPDGTILWANRAELELLGYAREEYVGHPIAAFHADQGVIQDILARLSRGEALHNYEARLRAKDGSIRHVLISSNVYWEGDRFVHTRCFTRDITQRKRAEENLRFLAAASAALADLSDYHSTLQKVAGLAVPFFADWCAVDMLDADDLPERLAVTHADPAKVQLARELRQRYPPRPDDPHGVAQVLRTGESELVEEIPDPLLVSLAQDDEHLRILRELGLRSLLCVPLLSRGKTLGALTFVTAESGRRYDANDLRVVEDLARRAVIAIENAALYQQLREADRRKDEFLAVLAHELRNPLAPIRNSLQIMRLAAGNGEVIEHARQMMERQLQQMVRIVDDLLDVSRITRGKVELRKERVELAAVVQSAVETSRPLVEASGHELTVTLPPEKVWLNVDPTRLAQVLANLLNNAAKYTRKRGRIGLTAERGGNEVVLRVRDNGIGIPTEMLPHVFDPFTQVDTTLGQSQGGLGIGLTLVKALVEMHDGIVEAHSGGPGQGSEFVVRLPLNAEDQRTEGAEGAEGKRSSPPASPARRILVVDDNVDAAESLGTLLKMMGHDVRLAYDGPAALEAARAYRPDLVLLDIGLPGMNGYEVARRIRQEAELRNVPLVAVTGWGQAEDRRRSQQAGFDHHLVKPADPEALEKLLASLEAPAPTRP